MAQLGTWKMRPKGVATVVELELRQRARSKKWYVALALWMLFIFGISALGFAALMLSEVKDNSDVQHAASVVFTLSVFLTVFTLLLVLPAMSSGAINGDRNAGTLAPLQATLLSPAEIVLGKVLAGWGIGLIFLALVVPLIGGVGLLSGAGPLYIVALLVAISFIALYIVAVGVGLSAMTRRQIGSAVLSYIVAVGTTLILPIMCVLALPVLSIGEREYTIYHIDHMTYSQSSSPTGYSNATCVKERESEEMPYSEVLVPLLAINPLVMVSDSAPRIPDEIVDPDRRYVRTDGLQYVAEIVRYAANPTHPYYHNSCGDAEMADGSPADVAPPPRHMTWLFGNAVWAAASVLAFVYAVLRSRTPMGRLPKGHRIT